jgi:hypothetical protein
MRRCDSCKTLYDNGVRICERCGTVFPYDPKISPFSEGKIAIILILVVAAVLIGINRYASMPITDNNCTRINYIRVQKLLNDSRDRVMRVQDHGYIPMGGSTTIMRERYMIEDVHLPPCFEPIREDMIEYYTLMYKATRISSFGGHVYTIPLLEQAANAQNRVDEKMEAINKCIPNCPTLIIDNIQSKN